MAIPGNDPQAIPCTGASFCVTVGYQTASAPIDAVSLNIYDGTSWSAPVTIAPSGGVQDVSCASPTVCAVGATVVVHGVSCASSTICGVATGLAVSIGTT